MRFVLECEVCRRTINEIADSTYGPLTSYRKMIICDKCKKNIAQLIKK